MSARWRKLQREFYLLRADNLDFQLHCSAYRMSSQYGSTDLPRYWITLKGKTIWDYPKDFIGIQHPSRENPAHYPYATDVSAISELIRDYIDTSKNVLLIKPFETDHWGLINILRAADRRVGVRRLSELKSKTHNKAARRVIEARANQGRPNQAL